MRKKMLLGLMFASILGVAAIAHLASRSNAQDPPKKAEPAEKKVNKPEVPGLPPLLGGTAPIASPPGGPVFPPLVEKPEIAPKRGVTSPLPSGTPPVIVDNEPTQPTPIPPPTAPPTVPSVGPQDPGRGTLPPSPPSSGPTPAPAPLTPPLNPPSNVQPPAVGPSPYVTPPGNVAQPTPQPEFPPAQPLPQQPRLAEKPPLPTVPVTSVPLKDSPWSLRVDMIDGQTILTASVNKKHEFKIVCQSLDLQTSGKQSLRATGKVKITSDLLMGSCDNLSIPLTEDRLILDGSAVVSIQRGTTNVSTEPTTGFELKGSTLDLRISELQPKLVQANWTVPQTVQAAHLPRDTAGMVNRTTTTPTPDAKKWTPYGVLRRSESKLGPMYSLETSSGPSLDLAPREGGSLDEYVGRTISVLGRMEPIQGSMRLRVTHIALP